MRWSIGIDPGLRETGMVLCEADDCNVVEWATFSCPSSADEDLSRVVSLASWIVEAVQDWVARYGIESLDVSIEMPIFKRNAATYTKQIRLLEEVESGLFYTVGDVVPELYLTEVYPSTSKVLLTGSKDASKDAMVAAYEIDTDKPIKANKSVREAVADAYAHSLAAWDETNKMTRMNLSNLKAAIVEETGRGAWKRLATKG